MANDNLITRTARILKIIEQIRDNPGTWSRKRLAETHGVSERMITKDIELIRYGLGYSVSSRYPGYQIKKN